MRRVGHSWREACALAIAESDPRKFIGRIDCAITALERRYAECESDPLTPTELTEIRKSLAALERVMQDKLREYASDHSRASENVSTVRREALLKELDHAKHVMRVLRP
jgi:hypothetical protein